MPDRQIGDAALLRLELRKQRQDALAAAVGADRIEQEAGCSRRRCDLDRNQVAFVDADALDQTERRSVIQSARGGDPVHRLFAHSPRQRRLPATAERPRVPGHARSLARACSSQPDSAAVAG